MRCKQGAAALAVLLALGIPAEDVVAQSGPRRQAGVEQILRLRERLELTEEQVTQLDALRKQALESRRAGLDELMELRSRVRAGDADASELRDAMAARREAAQARMDEHRGRMDAILSDAQQEQLRGLQRRGWARDRAAPRRGGRSGWRGHGPGFGPRGDAWGPRGGSGFGPRGFRRGPRFRRF